ncbi:MAG: T9SS type A sorting domain-containing protein [Bacteroidia bacterium]|nr:T9SS type A sorting domain-containing protein [Bacteroidia bacterium]
MRYVYLTTLITAAGLWQGLRAQPLDGQQPYLVNGSPTNLAARQFQTIQDAFNALESNGVDGTFGPVIIRVVTGYDPTVEPNHLRLGGYACSNPPCAVQVHVDIPVVLSKSPTTAQRFLLRLGGSPVDNLQFFTLNGRGNLRLVENTNSATQSAVIGISPIAGRTLSRIHIDSVIVDGVNRTQTYAGVYVGDSATLGNAIPSGSLVGQVQITNCQISGARHGIYMRGSTNGQVLAPFVSRCTIGIPEPVPNATNTDASFGGAGFAGGIYFFSTNGGFIQQNVIRNALQSTNPSAPGFAGIISDQATGLTIERNYIYNIRYTGTFGYGATGIRVTAPGSGSANVIVRNNFISRIGGDGDNTTGTTLEWMVSGIAVHAMATNSNVGVQILHNSIHLFNDDSASLGPNDLASPPAGFTNSIVTGIVLSSNVTGGVTISGNLIQNTHRRTASSARAFGIIINASSLAGSTINYNAYHINATVTGGNFIGRQGGTDYATLAAWQGIGYDANGWQLGSPVAFANDYDLHIDPLVPSFIIDRGNSALLPMVDYDGQTRPLPNPGPGPNGDPGSAPDIGADEVDGSYIPCPSVIEADAITLSPATPQVGQDITVSVNNASNLSGILTLRWSTNGGSSWTSVSVSPSSFPYTIPAPSVSSLPATLDVQLIANNVPGCPSLSPNTDTAVASVVITCPTPFGAGPVNITQDTVLFGAPITLNASPSAGTQYVIQWSYNQTTWNNLTYTGTFPATLLTPSSGLPSIPATLYMRLVVQNYTGCSPAADTSNVDSVVLNERPGNRLATAIPISLTYNSLAQRWEAVIQDSTNLGTTNEYGNPTAVGSSGTGNPRGTGAKDLFYILTLPTCMDSLFLNTCASFTNYDTRLNLINLTTGDTTSDEDACGLRSDLRVIGTETSNLIKPMGENWSTPTVDSVRLAAGDQIVIIVEGYSSFSQGRFELVIRGYGPELVTRPVPSLGLDTSLCIATSTSLPLDATVTPPADNYEWVVDGSVVSGANSPIYNLPLASGTYQVIARAIFNNTRGLANGPICQADTTADTIVVTVSPEPQAAIQVGTTIYPSGGTHNISSTSSPVSETFTVSSSTSGNSYQWELYNPGSSTANATGSGSSFSHSFSSSGVYTLILISTNGVCEERDTVFVNVSITTALGSSAGSFSAFPNPNSGSFTIIAPAVGIYELRVVDVAGKVVLTDYIQGQRKDLHLRLPAGTYQLLLSGEGRSEVIRLLIVE